MNKIFQLIIILIILTISKYLFILFKFHDQRNVNINSKFISQNISTYSDIKKQHGPINNDEVLEIGMYRLHPLSHPNDYDFNLAKIGNNMTILDCGCGFLGTENI